MLSSTSTILIPWILLVRCLSAQDTSLLSAYPIPSNSATPSAASFPSTFPATVISGASNVTATSSSRASSTTDDLTAIAGLPAASAPINGTALATTAARPRPTNTTPCNGFPEFCSRRFSNISMVVAHNSPFVRPHNAASNQEFHVLNQLNDGIRGCKLTK
jgi:hypothetical protein